MLCINKCIHNPLSLSHILVRHKHDQYVKQGENLQELYLVGFRGSNLATKEEKTHYIVSFLWEKNCYIAIFRGGTLLHSHFFQEEEGGGARGGKDTI